MKVKICGLTNLEDALVAKEAGADYLGFILYEKSKRFVTEKEVRCIVSHLRSLEDCPRLVGVFVNKTAEEMAETVQFCGLDLAQHHGGGLVPPFADNIYKAIQPKSYEEALEAADTFILSSEQGEPLSFIFCDAYHPNEYGGTGETGDWGIAGELVEAGNRADSKFRVMLAGGLMPENVGDAIEQVRPWGVDVASGTEASAGVKDPEKVRLFVKNAKASSIRPQS